ncbi:ATP-binding protein [Sphingomonas silueang]|uniref:ATP-binding protein n=1 Tax=Sphingomonas silueang TaxID=3156617 RepID=UPI0032B4C8C8
MRRPPLGLIGRIVAILLLTIVIEFGVSVLLYERASQFSVRDDEARRLAEHLVIARRIVEERPLAERAGMAAELTTDRYAVQWRPTPPALPAKGAELREMEQQVLAWEPTLADTGLHLTLASPGGRSVVTGALTLGDGSWLYFRTLEPLRAFDLAIGRILLALIPAIALMVVGGLLIRRTLRPMRQLADAVDRFGPGGLSALPPVEETGPGEVRRLVAAFNGLQARIHRLIEDRTRALAAVGHDLRTPLARLRLRTDAIRDAQVRDTVQNDLAEMEAMVTSLLAFLGGEGDPEKPMLVDIAVLCASIVDDAADHGHDATYAGPDHLERIVRRSNFRRAVVNLVENAVHYGGCARVTVAIEAGDTVIRVEDDGPGIPAESLALVLEPFVRLDSARKRDTVGFGLGLSIVARAVETEGGRLDLRNRTGGGLCAAIVLPAAAQ